MAEEVALALGQLRRRRGVTRSSITRLVNRLKELEATADQPATPGHAQQLLSKLNDLDSNFKELHMQIIDKVEEDETLEQEQIVLDKHDDDIAAITARLQFLMKPILDASVNGNRRERRSISLKMSRVEKGLKVMEEQMADLVGDAEDVDIFIVQQYQEQLSDYKKDIAALYSDIIALEPEDDDELFVHHSKLETALFDCSHKMKKLISSQPESAATGASGTGVKLPKIDVPTFDGNLLHWRQFWEQFSISVHNRKNLTNSEKLVYLQHSLKGGSAKNMIEGLSQSGEHYLEAIECLKSRYDRPRLIHQTHVRLILEVPPLKEGTGKELRHLHDIVTQHLRALKSMDYDPSGPFITSMLELKLDATTQFEWQKHSQSEVKVPHYQGLLNFIDLRAQAGSATIAVKKPYHSFTSEKKFTTPGKPPTSFTSHHAAVSNQCIVCRADKHPLYVCPKFQSLPHDQMVATLKDNNLCMNCLSSGHVVKHCKSVHKCRKCQKPHHTLLHKDKQIDSSLAEVKVSTSTAVRLRSNLLLMTCRIMVYSPDGSSIEARALLDSASSASFVSERLVQGLCLPQFRQNVRISGIGDFSHDNPVQHILSFKISAVGSSVRKIGITAIVVPKVTCDLPTYPVRFDSGWKHLTNLVLADPDFGQPGKIDLLLGADLFADVLRQGRRSGLAGSPVAFETEFGWVLSGRTESTSSTGEVTALHTTVGFKDDVLHKFWEIEEGPTSNAAFSLELGMDLGHAELVPPEEMEKPTFQVFYLPMHVVYKNSSTTTKIRAVFDASAKSSSGVSLNDILLVGPTVHSTLMDVLLRFRMHRIAITADINKMYRAVKLVKSDRDFHRFVWRSNQSETLKDYRMTRVTFGVSASSFAANMCVKQNAMDFATKYPLAAKAVEESFYVNDCLTGADSVEMAMKLQQELQCLLSHGGFLLWKWNSSNLTVLQNIDSDIRDSEAIHHIHDGRESTKTLGLEWNTKLDEFCLTYCQ